jgi:glutaredoxin-related protein
MADRPPARTALPLPQGTKQIPMCGFSNTVVQILNTMKVDFVSVNILEDELLRSGEQHEGRPARPLVGRKEGRRCPWTRQT